MARVKLDIIGKDKASPAVKSVTKSFIVASLAVEGLKIATKALIDVTKKSIEAFKVQEQAEAALEAQTGGNIEANKEFASSIQAVTTVGDEAILVAQQLGLQMGIAESEINNASQQAVGLSESLGIDLNNAMKLIANAQSGNTSALARYIPELKNTTTQTEALALINEKAAKGFEVAKAKAETFTGRMQQLNNTQGDVLESFGRVISIVGKDYVEGMNKSAQSLNKFISSGENVGNIAGAFKVIEAAVKPLFNTIKSIGLKVFQDLKNELGDLDENGSSANVMFQLLAGTMTTITTVLKIVGDIISGVVKQFLNFIQVAKEAGEVFSTIMKVFKKEATFDDVKESLSGLGDAFQETGQDFLGTVNDIVSDGRTGFDQLINNTQEQADQYAEIFKEIKDNVKKEMDGVSDIVDTAGSEITKSTGSNLEKGKVTWKNWSSFAIETVQSTMDIILEGLNNSFQQQQALIQENLDSRLSSIDAATQAQMEAEGVAEETRTEGLNRQIETLSSALATETDIEEKKRLEAEIKDAEAEKRRIQILTSAEKKKESARKKATKKEEEEKKKQAETNKAFAIANVWINAASAIIASWAAYASIPFAGPILAGVQTAAILGLAGAQTGVIASQGFQDGGIVPGNSLTGDRVQISANSGEAVIQQGKFNRLMDIIDTPDIGGGGFTNNGQITIVANNPEEFQQQLIELQRFELAGV